jgi:hypothetical protein
MSFRLAIIPFAAFTLAAFVGCEDTTTKPAPVAETPKTPPKGADKGLDAPVSSPLKAPIKD